VASDADDAALAELWRTARDKSPLYQTLSRCARVEIDVRPAY
jgi:hypothetical protein